MLGDDDDELGPRLLVEMHLQKAAEAKGARFVLPIRFFFVHTAEEHSSHACALPLMLSVRLVRRRRRCRRSARELRAPRGSLRRVSNLSIFFRGGEVRVGERGWGFWSACRRSFAPRREEGVFQRFFSSREKKREARRRPSTSARLAPASIDGVSIGGKFRECAIEWVFNESRNWTIDRALQRETRLSSETPPFPDRRLCGDTRH